MSTDPRGCGSALFITALSQIYIFNIQSIRNLINTNFSLSISIALLLPTINERAST